MILLYVNNTLPPHCSAQHQLAHVFYKGISHFHVEGTALYKVVSHFHVEGIPFYKYIHGIPDGGTTY